MAVDAHESSLTPWVPRYAPAAIQVSPPLLPKTFAAAHLRMAMREAKAIINTAGDSPGGFYEWFEMQRRDADTGRIPFEKLQAARESALMARGAPGRAPLGGANPICWPIGPSTIPDGQTDVTAGAALSPVSGRLQAIAVHPTSIPTSIILIFGMAARLGPKVNRILLGASAVVLFCFGAYQIGQGMR